MNHTIIAEGNHNSPPPGRRGRGGGPNHLTRGEVLAALGGSVLFLLVQTTVVGLIPAQVLMVAIFNVLFFAHPQSRRLAVALLPFVVFEISYDWMRLYPNYRVNPIDIRGIYEAELQLFGVTAEGQTMIPGQYLQLHHAPLPDLLSGLFYLCWVPGPMALGLWLIYRGRHRDYLRFVFAFLMVNFVGFAGYYIHPAAPPWYALNYGFEPDFSMPGNVAGLIHFDRMVGIPVFQSIYVNNSNIFAAVPSLHSAYMLTATVYAVVSRRSRGLIALCAMITAGIWWTAVYSCHHYIIDVLLGIVTACIGILLFECVVLRWPAFSRFFRNYTAYIAGAQQAP